MNKRGTEKKKNRKKEGEKARAMVRERLRESGQWLERSQDAFKEIRAVTRERGSRNDSKKKEMRERANIIWGKRVRRKRKRRTKEVNILDIREKGKNEREIKRGAMKIVNTR